MINAAWIFVQWAFWSCKNFLCWLLFLFCSSFAYIYVSANSLFKHSRYFMNMNKWKRFSHLSNIFLWFSDGDFSAQQINPIIGTDSLWTRFLFCFGSLSIVLQLQFEELTANFFLQLSLFLFSTFSAFVLRHIEKCLDANIHFLGTQMIRVKYPRAIWTLVVNSASHSTQLRDFYDRLKLVSSTILRSFLSRFSFAASFRSALE